MNISPGELYPSEAAFLNERLQRVEALLQLRTVAPLMFDMRGGTPILSIIERERIVARITGHEDSGDYSESAGETDSAGDYPDEHSCRYSFVQVQFNKDTCASEDVVGGYTGLTDRSPAVHIGGLTDIGVGAVVEMWRTVDGSHWEFGTATGGGLEITVVLCTELIANPAGDSSGDSAGTPAA